MDTSNRTTHRRKPPTTMKVKFDFARTKQRAEGEESDNASTASSKNSAPNTRDNSVDRSDDEIPDHLPEGTVVVRPEPVKEKRPRFHGPEFSKSKKDGVALEELNKVSCTACGRQINPQITHAAKKHPVLKVLICRKCYKYYQSGEIGQDEDGLDEQCRWCGDGGKLNGCDYCHNAFCKSCVLRNFGRSELSVVTDADKKWKCYVCDPGNLAKLQVECDTVLQAVELARVAAGCSSAKSNGFKSSADSGRKASDKPLTDIVSTLTFNHEDIGKKLTRLQTATQTFAMVLETLTAKLKPSAQEEDTDELSQEDTDGLSQEDKEKKCMRFVEKGLRTYMTSIQSILIPPTSVEPASAGSSQPNGTGKEKSEPPKTQKRTGIPPKKKSGGKNAEESNSDKSEESDGAGADDTDNSVVAPTPKAAASKKKKASADCDDSPRRKPAVQKADKPRENKGSDEDEEATAESPAAGPESPMEEEAKESTAKSGAEKAASVADEGGSKDEIDNSINIDNEVAHLQLLEEMAQEIGHDLDDKIDESEMSVVLKKGNDEQSDSQDDALLPEEVENKVERKSLDEDKEDMEVDDMNKDEEGEENKDEDEEGSDTKKVDKPKKKSKGLAGSSSKNSPSPKKSKHSKSVDKDNSDEDSDSDDSPSQKKSSKSDKAKAGKGRDEGKKDGKTKGAKTEKGKKASKSSIVDEDSISSSDLIMSDDDDWKERATQSKKGGRRRRTAAARSRKEESESSSSEEDDKKEKKSRRSKKSETEKEDSKKEDSKKESSKKERSKKEGFKKDSPKKEGAKKEGSKKEGSKKEASKKDDSEKEETKPRRRRGKGSHSSDEEEDEDAKLDREIAALEKKPQLRKEKMPAASDDDEEDENESAGEEEKDTSAKKSKKRKKGSDDETQERKRKKKASSGSESDDEDEEDDEDDEEDNEDEEEIAKAKKLVGGDDTMEGSDVDRKARASGDDKEEEEDEEDNDDDKSSDDSDDFEDTKKKRAKKDKSTKEDGKEKSDDEERAKDEDDKEAENEEDMEVEDEDGLDNRTKQFRNSLLDAKLSESDSDIEVKPKVKGRGKKRKKGSDEESFKASSDNDDEEDDEDDDDDDESDDKSNSESDDDDDDSDSKKKKKKGKKGKKGKGKGKGKKGKKRRRIKNNSDSDDSGSDNEEQKEGKGRKKIRNIISDKKLKDTTKAAAKAEQERRKRVEELQKQFNVVTVTDDKAPNACPVTTQLVLEVDPETKEPIIEVNKKLIKKLKPHQVEAVQFLWSSCIESLKRCKKEEGSGCLLAHCMGLGKTLSVVTFVHTLLANAKKTRIHTALIVCPLNTVLNWQNELHMWLSSKDQLDVWELTSVKNNMVRAEKLKEWHTEGGVMIMGYEMYRNLSRGANCKSKRHKAVFRETLVDPGPDVVVCDEGHILKNDASALSKAMNEMKTRRRIVLTGTPLQNNLSEYHCMVNFIKPDLLGTRKEFLNRFVNPITNGQHSDATPSDVKLMKKRAHVLHEMLAGCVQRKDYSALTRFLPPKFEYVMSVRLSTIQMKLYEMYLQNRGINSMGEGELTVKGGKLFSDYQFLMRVWTHPWVLKLAEIRQDQKVKYDDYDDEDEELNDSFIDDNTSDEESEAKSTSSGGGDSDVIAMDSDEEAAPSTSRGTRRTRAQAKAERKDDNEDEIVKKWNTRSRRGEEPKSESEEEVEENKEVSSEWWAEFVKQEDAYKMELSGKLMLLFEVLSRCEEIGDKVLVFSQSLLSLDIIEDFLATVDRKFQEETSNKEDEDGDNSKFVFGKTWTKGADYFRMDGSTGAQLRQSWAEHFNDPENYRSRLFLISTKAGSLGINLVAANRVIIFDASWNPSHDIQSIFRVYRFGQEKPCYIYRFLAQGTMEEKIYLRQVTKQSLSQRVVDEHQIERHFTQSDLQDLYRFQPDRLDDPDRVEQVFSLPKDTLLAELLKSHKDWIVTYHEHDSLLENQVDQNLTEEEKKSAWDEYENEKKGLYNRVQHPNMYQGQPMGGNSHLYNMLSSMRPEHVQHIAQTIRAQYPHLSPEEYEQHVHQALMQQLRFQDMFQKQLYEQRQQQEYQRLREIQQQIQQQQQQQQRLQQQRLHQQQQIQQQQMQQQQMQVAGGYAPGSVMHRLMGGAGAGSMPEMNQGLAGLRNSLQSTMQKDGSKSTDGASGGSSKEGQPSSSK